MASGVTILLPAILATALFAQVKTGDPAPNLTWTRIVASTPASGGPNNLAGEVTVLQFLRPVSVNPEAVEQWNKLADQFSDRVNFIWIANEKEETLARFLKTHSVRGWLILDPDEESFKAYGMDKASDCGVVIDAHGIIAGFTFMTPDARQLQAVLDGKPAGLEAEPNRLPAPPEKPDLPPSTEPYISVSQTHANISMIAPDYWIRQGVDLKSHLASLYHTTADRIDLPASLANKRYDIVLIPPREEDEETMNAQIREGIEKYFNVSVARAVRPMDVYVMTAIEGKTRPPKPPGDDPGGSFASSYGWSTVRLPEGAPHTREAMEEASRQAMAVAELTEATAISSTVDEFCTGLEEGLHRPVVDQTHLTGVYDFKIKGEAHNAAEFLAMLRDQLGLILTPTQYSIDVILVMPRH
jgi:uncharacterized protein (TIGR03435 family)